jgi:hypothetical protein
MAQVEKKKEEKEEEKEENNLQGTKLGKQGKGVEKSDGGELVPGCMTALATTWVTRYQILLGLSEKSYEVHLRTIPRKRKREIYPLGPVPCWSRVSP